MFVIGEMFTDLRLQTSVEVSMGCNLLACTDINFGGAGHVARLLKRFGVSPAPVLTIHNAQCEYFPDIPDKCERLFPLRVTIVEYRSHTTFIQPVSDMKSSVLEVTDLTVPPEALSAWQESDRVCICSHDYMNICSLLDVLHRHSEKPRTYFVSGTPDLFRYRFPGECYFFLNRKQASMYGVNLHELTFAVDVPDVFAECLPAVRDFWRHLLEHNNVRGLFITLDESGVLAVGMPVESHYVCVDYGAPNITWYPSRVRYLADDIGCGDAFMVGFLTNLDVREPIRAGLLAARHCAQFNSTVYA